MTALGLGLGLPFVATHSKGVSFNLDAFMAAQADGLYFDFTKTDRLFQENTGPTPADDPGETIGLALDSRSWGGATLAQEIAAATEVVSNGGFDSASGWSLVGGGTGSISGGVATVTRTTSYTAYEQAIPLVAGKTYRFKCRARRTSGTGTILMVLRDSTGTGTALFTRTISSPSGAWEDVEIFYTAVATATRYLQGGVGSAAAVVEFDDFTTKEVRGRPGVQGTESFKPKTQVSGAEFDGVDDNHLVEYRAASGANFIVAKVTVASLLSGTQIIAGAYDGVAGRSYLAIGGDGKVGGGVGAEGNGVIVGTSDVRGTTVVVGLSFDGATVKIFVDDAEEYSGAQSGTPTTTVPYRIGALNNNGTASNFFGGTTAGTPNAHIVLVGREALNLARFKQIVSDL